MIISSKLNGITKNKVSWVTTIFPRLRCQKIQGEGKTQDVNRNEEDLSCSQFLIDPD